MNPNEVFSFPTEATSKEAKNAVKKYFCRFLDEKCDKQSRTIPYPMGVCSVNHSGNKAIICPHRFLEKQIVFNQVCNEIWGNANNVLLFSEIKVENVGSFDFVLVKHKPISNKIDDFCIVEFQSDSTTGTGKLVEGLKDFMAGQDVNTKKYSFGLNTYNTIKLSYIQMLVKGQVMERWNKHIIWIMQQYVYDNMVNRFYLTDMEYDFSNNNKYFIYDLEKQNDIYTLQLIDKKSSTVANLLRAFTHQPTPSIDDFLELLQTKVKMRIGLQIG